MNDLTDLTELVERARAGDQLAWDEIVARFSGLLWAVARAHRLDAPTASDVVQVTWLRLVENLDRIHEPRALAGWLATTARREALRVLRAHDREVLDSGDQRPERADENAPDLDAALLTDERDVELWGAFRRLGERCQQLLRILMAPEAPAYVEVSATLGMPVGSIGPTRARCLTRLRQLLGQTGYNFRSATERRP